MSAPVATGGTVGDQYRAVVESPGWGGSGALEEARKALEIPPCPWELQQVMEVYWPELQSARQSNGFSQGSISYSEILAWAQLTGRQMDPLTVQCIKDLDNAYLTELHKQASANQPKK